MKARIADPCTCDRSFRRCSILFTEVFLAYINRLTKRREKIRAKLQGMSRTLMTWNTNIDNRLAAVQGFPRDQTEKFRSQWLNSEWTWSFKRVYQERERGERCKKVLLMVESNIRMANLEEGLDMQEKKQVSQRQVK